MTDSSRIPAVELRSIQARIIKFRSRYFCLPNFLIIIAIMYFKTPHLSRIRKVPPISVIIRIIPTPVKAVSVPKTRIGARIIFQIGILS